MKGTYSSEQAGPTHHCPLMDHNSSLFYQTYFHQNQPSFPSSLAQTASIPSLFPSQDFNTENIHSINTSFGYSFTGFHNYTQYDQLTALELSHHHSFSSNQTNNNIFDHNVKVTFPLYTSLLMYIIA